MSLNRRKFLKGAILLHGISSSIKGSASNFFEGPTTFKRVRPGDPLWPSPAKWEELAKAVNGNFIKIESPFIACKTSQTNAECETLFKNLKNPYFIGDNPALTQTSGWLSAWKSAPSEYAVAAKNSAEVAIAVNFARENNLRLVIKGGGHSYQGTSCSKDSLLIWTRAMNEIIIHDDFVAQDCSGIQKPQQAVSVGSGAIWVHVYDKIMAKAGRYVQGGGCGTVGVAGLIQSGGFGSHSKNYGLAAASLLEAEVVTADGKIRIANACTNADLFWAIKGGGGGSFGVVTRLTLKTYELPNFFGGVFGTIKAKSDKAFRHLITQTMNFYADKLFNPHWSEQVRFYDDNTVHLQMVFQGLTQQEAEQTWKPFIDSLNKEETEWTSPFAALALPAQKIWDIDFLKKNVPDFIAKDDRPNASEDNIFWKSQREETGQYLYAYHSAWLPASLLKKDQQNKLIDALYNASRFWTVSLHCGKGLAGAPDERIAEARDTATNPDVLNAFALAIIAGASEPAFVGMQGHEPDLADARDNAKNIDAAINELLKAAPNAGSYVSESNYFEPNWQRSFWGSNYDRLAKVKKMYDPDGLFFVHHGVGSEEWSNDGFSRLR